MLCSVIRKMCSTTSTRLLQEQPLQKSTSYLNKAFNTMASPITPPSSPPSPAMSMESINGDEFDDHDSQQTRKIKVMIIDDNAINLSILSRLLNKHFADTIQLTSVQSSGLSALNQLTKDEVDLILMDIDMPELSGVETTTAIRTNNSHTGHSILEQNKTVPIIAVTTSDAEEQRELYRKVGMADCVSKPIAVPKLRMAIEEAMKAVHTVATTG
ncbi:sensitivity to red-light reduced protein [Lobosporangium transversale]|uniref:CheY-like superfamily n=1 Tax=Lobosporangium transversale TaxID=64571 RepID=A0A1Y2H2P7_9FUNG|nr:CheY-like superfamily [Lobosporangium transversale]KAF9896920.1 sensitivity to red-light reduced protein [Lobosporangium transversale]ORZ28827.1 CheY-like superfamily [Lobosporangium transversale]|eukprot:XP_021886500.1 CheY-like superfamily [Lobosporangium transversale]